MPAKGPLTFRMGDKNIVSIAVINRKTRLPVDLSGGIARIRFEVFSDPNDPTGSTLAALSRNVSTTPDADNGQIDDGAGGLGTLIFPAADLATANPDLKRAGSYRFAAKVLDTNGDPYTVYRGPCMFEREEVTDTP